MTSFNLQLFSGENKFTQKCLIPFHYLEKADFQIGDFVTLQSSVRIYICRIHTTAWTSSAALFVDDVVTCENSALLKRTCKEIATFPDNFAAIKISNFEHVIVRIVCEDGKNILNCGKITYESLIHKFLSRYVIAKNYVVNCKGSKLAESFHIHSIIIMQTFPEKIPYGRLIRSSKVEISDLKFWKQIYYINEFQYVKLGGMRNATNFLKLNCFGSAKSKILVSGPSGCGKSIIVKAFCCNFVPFFVILDAFENMTLNKCDAYYVQFSRYLNMFPSNKCILFIDNLNTIVPRYSKQNILSSVSSLVHLIRRLDELQVLIIGAAPNKRSIHPNVATLFDQELNLGIPSFLQRKEMIETQAKLWDCNTDCEKIAQMTPGFIASDIALLFTRTADIASDKKLTCKYLTTEDFENCLADISPSVLKSSLWNMKVQPVYWKDIGGMFTVKQKLQMCIEWPLRNPEVFQKVDLPCPHGVLLYGPPGCCKTTLARGLATECNANFFAANPSQIYSPYVGESEKNIAELFYQARLCAPSIIFLDELDSLVSKRKFDTKSQGIGGKVLSTLLNEMDGFGTKMEFQNINQQTLLNKCGNLDSSKESKNDDYQLRDEVIVVAATNRPDLIDDALLRPGRFDVILYVPPPNTEERESIIQTLTDGMPLKDVDFKKLAENTNFYSGADLKHLCKEAAMNALRQDISSLCDISYITEENFSDALKKIQPSITKQQIEMYEKISSKYGTIIKRC